MDGCCVEIWSWSGDNIPKHSPSSLRSIVKAGFWLELVSYSLCKNDGEVVVLRSGILAEDYKTRKNV